MRSRPFLPLMLLLPAISAPAQVSISIGLPHLSTYPIFGIFLPKVGGFRERLEFLIDFSFRRKHSLWGIPFFG